MRRTEHVGTYLTKRERVVLGNVALARRGGVTISVLIRDMLEARIFRPERDREMARSRSKLGMGTGDVQPGQQARRPSRPKIERVGR